MVAIRRFRVTALLLLLVLSILEIVPAHAEPHQRGRSPEAERRRVEQERTARETRDTGEAAQPSRRSTKAAEAEGRREAVNGSPPKAGRRNEPNRRDADARADARGSEQDARAGRSAETSRPEQRGAAGDTTRGQAEPQTREREAKSSSGANDASARTAAAGWGKPGTLNDHYNRHGKDFGATSPADYVQKSQSFYEQRSQHLQKVDSAGTTRVYEPKTNTFGSYNINGTTRTFYKPNPAEHKERTNMDYWAKQPGTSP